VKATSVRESRLSHLEENAREILIAHKGSRVSTTRVPEARTAACPTTETLINRAPVTTARVTSVAAGNAVTYLQRDSTISAMKIVIAPERTKLGFCFTVGNRVPTSADAEVVGRFVRQTVRGLVLILFSAFPVR
jgi:hypothetical protein